MPMNTTFAGELMAHLLNNADIALIGDLAGLLPSAADGNLYIAGHTGDPGASGSQTTSECAYGDYARIAVTRDGTAWTIAGAVASLAANQLFPEASSGSETMTHITVGTASSGAGKVLFRGALDTPIVIVAGVQPRINAGTTVTGVTT